MARIDQIQQLLQGNPKDNFLKHALALEYIKVGNDTDAGKVFEALLSNDPSYVGSYYHLAKLYERAGETAAAISTYKNGMEMASAAKDMHAYNELKNAYEDFIY